MSAWRNISIGDETWPSWQTTILTNGWIFITSVSVLLIIVLQIRTWNFGSMSKILDILIQKVIYSYFTDWFSFFRSHVDLEYPDLDLDRDNWEVQVSSIIGPAHCSPSKYHWHWPWVSPRLAQRSTGGSRQGQCARLPSDTAAVRHETATLLLCIFIFMDWGVGRNIYLCCSEGKGVSWNKKQHCLSARSIVMKILKWKVQWKCWRIICSLQLLEIQQTTQLRTLETRD